MKHLLDFLPSFLSEGWESLEGRNRGLVLAAVGGCAVVLGYEAIRRYQNLQQKRKIAKILNSSYDYIVIGGGSAGCVVADRLSESGRHSVLLVEAGGKDGSTKLFVPQESSKLRRTKYDWKYHTLMQSATNDRIHLVPRGKVLGGSSALGSGLYCRGHRHDFDTFWGKSWGWEKVFPYFLKSENYLGRTNQFHSQYGPLPVSLVVKSNVIAASFIEAYREAGFPSPNEDYNSGYLEGAFLAQMTIQNGQKVSSSSAFLQRAKCRKNLTILTDHQVVRIIFDHQKTAVGIEVKNARPLPPHPIAAKKEVILCAGAIGSPHLLLLSGVGPASQLVKNHIPLVQNLAGVGENLQDHLMVPLIFAAKTDAPMQKKKLKSWRSLLRYKLFRSGPLSLPPLQSIAFIKSKSNIDAPDVQLQVVCGTFGDGLFEANANLEFDPQSAVKKGFVIFPTILCPQSRGSVKLQSNDAFDPPAIDPGYLKEREDEEALIRGIKAARYIADQPALKAHILHETAFSEQWERDVRSENYTRTLVKQRAISSHNLVGTCKMGPPSDPLAVVDPETLQIRGLKRIRIVDCSVIPRIPRGNTNAFAILIGERGSDLIIKDM